MIFLQPFCMNTPSVSIIIPTYNRAHLIRVTLDCVFAQTYTNWECIIVDDGSTDVSEAVVMEYVKKDSRFHFYKRTKEFNSGGNGARNYGAKLSKSEFLIFLDSDDLLKKNALENRLKNINLFKKKIDLLINNTAVFKYEVGDSTFLWNIYRESDTNLDLLKKFLNTDMPWHTNGVTWSKEFFYKVGGWNESLKSWQDWDIHVIALLLNPIIISGGVKPDNFYKIEGSNGIKDKFRTLNYYKSVKVALMSVTKELQNNLMFTEVENEFNKLSYRILINMAISNKFYFEPIKNISLILKIKKINVFMYSYFFLLDLFCQSSKIKRYLLKNLYKNYRNYINVNKTFMKLTKDNF